MVSEIVLSSGNRCLVDDDDYVFLSQWAWQENRKGYAVRSIHLGKVEGKYKKTCCIMHRILTAAPEYMQVDHIDGNKKNNQKSNLRLCTNSQNQMNGTSYKKSSSKYRGVSWNNNYKKWVCQIQKDKKKTQIGMFDSEIDAALAYNKMAKKLFGEFVRLNVVTNEVFK